MQKQGSEINKEPYWYYCLEVKYENRLYLINLFEELNKRYNIFSNNDYKYIAHHCTIIHMNDDCSFDKSTIDNIINVLKDCDIVLTITDIGFIKDKVAAFKCDMKSFSGINRTYHITVATANDVKPYESNNIKDWIKLDEPRQIYTSFKYVEYK